MRASKLLPLLALIFFAGSIWIWSWSCTHGVYKSHNIEIPVTLVANQSFTVQFIGTEAGLHNLELANVRAESERLGRNGEGMVGEVCLSSKGELLETTTLPTYSRISDYKTEADILFRFPTQIGRSYFVTFEIKSLPVGLTKASATFRVEKDPRDNKLLSAVFLANGVLPIAGILSVATIWIRRKKYQMEKEKE